MRDCRFCAQFDRVSAGNRFGSVFALLDKYPVTAQHWLIIPRRHCLDYFDLTVQEKRDTDDALFALRARVLSEDSDVTGFNIGWNCGVSAGQTVMHAHAHLIPRRTGDVVDARGGVRGVIPEKQHY